MVDAAGRRGELQIAFHSRVFLTYAPIYMGAHESVSVQSLPGPSFARFVKVISEFRTTTVSRRDFTRALISIGGALVAAPGRAFAMGEAELSPLRMAMAFPVIDPLFEKGFELGAAEAARSASLFNVEVSSQRVPLDSRLSAARAIDGIKSGNIAALITCSDETTTREVAEQCAAAGIIHVSCGSRADALRRNVCRESTFHVEASQAMYDGARALAPNAKSIELWDPNLERYGAAQLNDRFKSFSGEKMNGAAWAGWFAVKAVFESFLRGSGDISAWIKSDRAQFDGHKGAPLSFRSWDGQLRQPLYAIGDRIVDVPDTSRSTNSPREILDTIGDRSGAQSCRRSP